MLHTERNKENSVTLEEKGIFFSSAVQQEMAIVAVSVHMKNQTHPETLTEISHSLSAPATAFVFLNWAD